MFGDANVHRCPLTRLVLSVQPGGHQRPSAYRIDATLLLSYSKKKHLREAQESTGSKTGPLL